MPLNPSTLANQLANMTPTDSEIEAIGKFTDAYIAFMSEAQCGPYPIIPAALQGTPKTAMMGAMTGMSTAGAASIQLGITAFWGAMVPIAITLFPTATVIVPPPTLATISGLLIPVFTANTSGKLELQPACTTIASVIYTGSLGGMAAIMIPPAPSPIPTPIL